MVERLSRSLLYTYGIADLFFNVMISMEAYFFPAFLTDYAQFSLVLAGQILGLTSLIDILCAIVGGIILQKVTLRHGGKYRSWFLIGPSMFAPLFILQFTKIGSDFIAALIVIFGFVSSHLLFNIVVSASGAMVGRLTHSSDERTILSASRAQGMSAGGLVFSVTAMPMIVFFGAHTNRVAGFTLTVTVYTILMVIGYWFVFHLTSGRDPYDEAVIDSSKRKSGQPVKEIVGQVFINPPLLFLIFAQAFSSTSFFVITAMAVYYFAYVIGKPAFLSLFLLAISIARLVGTFTATWIGVRIGKRRCYCIFLTVAALGFASARFLTESIWVFTLAFCFSILSVSIAASMNTALFSDTVVYGEWKTGKNIRAFTMALMNIPIKAGVLIRSVVVTAGLMAIGFVANAAPGPGVIHGISSIITLVPAAGYAIAALIFSLGYKIDESQIMRMQEEIAERKSGELVRV